MGNSNWFILLVRLLYVAWEWFRNVRREAHTDAVRSDGGSAWLRKFGGTDKRASSADDAGGDHH